MTSAYILIAAILVLGGLIAALGDRLGSKVGKARLRLFNLRPRQTAALVTVITGTTIAASTLILLFSLSESLREGVFELDDILKKRREIKAELEQVKDEKNEFEEELKATQKAQEKAQRGLDQINQKFLRAQEKLKTVSDQAGTLRKDISSLLEEREDLLEQKETLGTQIEEFREQVAEQDREIASQKDKLSQQQENLQAQEKVLANQQNSLEDLQKQQSTLQTEISQRDQALQEKESDLETLEKQLTFLRDEVSILENNYQGLRATNIALVRGQILASTVVKVDNSVSAQQRISRLLQLANQVAIERSLGGSSENQGRVIKIANNQVQELVKHISDNREYVVRIVSAGNYVRGEAEVRVFPDAILNKRVFQAGEVIAAISFDSQYPTLEEIQRQIDWLMSASQFRVRRAGILGNIQIEDGGLLQLVDFVDQITEFEDSIEEIRTVATQGIYTAGPAKISLVALKDGKVVLRTY